MAELVELEIITAQRMLVRTQVSEVYVPAANGQAGILHHHLPYTALLGMGEVSYVDASGKRHGLFLRQGLVETADNRVVILAERVVTADELQKDELEKEMREVKQAIRGALSGETSPEELESALARERELDVMQKIVKTSAAST
ncbi:MAG TPA: ATP synthase F1 subunit epsilon [Candidatus Aminicenantes bacterium]|nr:ATP synthase F1 subunit epsilon [Candidatus Aminicenantes bacterium]